MGSIGVSPVKGGEGLHPVVSVELPPSVGQ